LSDIKEVILAEAKALGFDSTGFAPARAEPATMAHFQEYLSLGRHGNMAWLADRAEQRRSPDALWDGAKSVIMLGMNYGPGSNPLALLDQKSKANISVYARGRDYHDVFKKRLKRLGRWLHSETDLPLKVFVDTAPVMEKPLAAAAGIGWQGKHTNLVSPDFGSWLFLGAIFTALEIAPDAPHADQCGSCHKCLDICPTKAFPAPYQLDARRCISYLTIEHKGVIPRHFRRAIGNRVYGCDDCLAVCPWNKFAEMSQEMKFHAREELLAPDIAEWLTLDDAAFRTLFSGSPVKRTGRDRFLRNLLIAAGNSADKSLLDQIGELLSDAAPVVRATAAWAFRELAEEDDIAAARQAHAAEEDETVIAEWMQ
jgi:epoxyqueuosine reductase